MKKIFITIIVILAIIAVFVYVNSSSDEESISYENGIEENAEIPENISEEEVDSAETVNYENFVTNITNAEITQVAFPTGFMGSSLYKVVLFSTGDVYVQKFDGEDENLENIVSEELIAESATSITTIKDEEDANYGKVTISGGNAVNSDYGWIEFIN